MPVVWHPKRWWNFCMSDNELKKRRKEIEPIFTEGLQKFASVVYGMG